MLVSLHVIVAQFLTLKKKDQLPKVVEMSSYLMFIFSLSVGARQSSCDSSSISNTKEEIPVTERDRNVFIHEHDLMSIFPLSVGARQSSRDISSISNTQEERPVTDRGRNLFCANCIFFC